MDVPGVRPALENLLRYETVSVGIVFRLDTKRTARLADVRMDQGFPRDRGDFLDGRDALAAAPVRLSLRGGDRIEAVRNL